MALARARIDKAKSRRAVAEYHAVVSATVERSRLAINPVAKSVLYGALEKPPSYWPRREEYPGLGIGTGERHLKHLVLLKLAALFEFGAALGGKTGDEVRDRVYAEFPAAKKAALQTNDSRPATRYLRIPIVARVRADGEPEWGATLPPRGAGVMPAGSRSAFEREIDGRPAWEIYLQNLVRAEIYDELAKSQDALGL